VLFRSLPVLNRKWDKVDINFISRKKKSVQNIENVKKLYNLSDNEISKILGISRRTVCRIRKENNIITI
jgi:DNA-directed RNA polymerase alpha subunit